MRRNALFVAVVAAAACFAVAGILAAGEPGARAAAPVDDDPFAELLRNNPAEVVKTGPTCRYIKVQLPPGITPEDIGLSE